MAFSGIVMNAMSFIANHTDRHTLLFSIIPFIAFDLNIRDRSVEIKHHKKERQYRPCFRMAEMLVLTELYLVSKR